MANKVYPSRISKPTSFSPSPMSLNRINHTSQNNGEQNVTIEVAALSYGTGHNGGTSGGKGALNKDEVDFT